MRFSRFSRDQDLTFFATVKKLVAENTSDPTNNSVLSTTLPIQQTTRSALNVLETTQADNASKKTNTFINSTSRYPFRENHNKPTTIYRRE